MGRPSTQKSDENSVDGVKSVDGKSECMNSTDGDLCGGAQSSGSDLSFGNEVFPGAFHFPEKEVLLRTFSENFLIFIGMYLSNFQS